MTGSESKSRPSKAKSIATREFMIQQKAQLQINNLIKIQEIHEASPYKESIKLTYTPIAIFDYLSKADFMIANSNAC